MASIAKDHGKTRDPEKSRAAVSRKLTHLLFPRLERLTRALSRTSLQLWLFSWNLVTLSFPFTQVVPNSFPNWIGTDLALPLT